MQDSRCTQTWPSLDGEPDALEATALKSLENPQSWAASKATMGQAGRTHGALPMWWHHNYCGSLKICGFLFFFHNLIYLEIATEQALSPGVQIPGSPGGVPGFSSHLQLLPMQILQDSRWWLRYLDSCHSWERPGVSSNFLLLPLAVLGIWTSGWVSQINF